MELTGINPHKTTSAYDVSFTVHPAPEQEILERVKLRSVQLAMLDGYLQVTVPESREPIGRKLIDTIAESYSDAYQQHHAELQEYDRKRRLMLETVCRNTRLDVMKDA